ncbi:MAG: hypothetical protein Q4G59_04810, partial [Planctomycetia bacterium]|nr:hypothetical protein [Planctomycetia bacterium]
WMKIVVDGKTVREFIIELAPNARQADFIVPLDVSAWKGKKAMLIAEAVSSGSEWLKQVTLSDIRSDEKTAWREKYRPQFHFSPRLGWTNDPNGLVFFDGKYHLFYQHNPFGVTWNNMTWGHAVSSDLFHWQELDDAIWPDELGTIFSGSAAVDWKNSSRLGANGTTPLVALFTYNGPSMRYGAKATQALAWSEDGGMSWKKYSGNPVLKNMVEGNRDPKIFWHEPTSSWITPLYMSGNDYAIFRSPDLKNWEKACDVPALGCSECPDLFELPVDGNKAKTKWVFWGGNGLYVLGDFDGRSFVRQSSALQMKWGGNDYAAQTYSDTPGRRIQISWMQGGHYPGMPFNQQFTVPRELTLKSTPQGIRLCANPVAELNLLRREHLQVARRPIDGRSSFETIKSELLDIEAVIDPRESELIRWEINGRLFEFDLVKMNVKHADATVPFVLENGRIRLRLVLDRTSTELFLSGGQTLLAACYLPEQSCELGEMKLRSRYITAVLEKMDVWSLKSSLPTSPK